MSLKNLNIRFWLVTLAAILSIAVTMRLGFWQLSRANEKLNLQASIEQQTALQPLDAKSMLATNNALMNLHRTVILKGRWLPQYNLFLDNRQMEGKVGFFVLTPFEFEVENLNSKKTILVQRGWVARNFLDRQQLPQLHTLRDIVTIKGRIAPSPSKLYEFKGADSGAIRQNVSITELSQEIKIDMLNMTLLQIDDVNTAQANDGLLRHWPQPNLGVEKHYGYMFQWWALSALIAILYAWFKLIRPRMQPHTQANHE